MTNSAPANTEEILAAIEGYCGVHEAKIPYHVGRIREFAQDSSTVEDIANGWADEGDLMSLEDRLRSIQLYLETQGDKFHPHSDDLRAIAGESTPWES